MDLTTALTGALPFIILVSAVLTMIFSFLLLWLYRRAVIRSMGASGGSNTPTTVASTQVAADNLSPLTITTLKDKALLQGRAKVLFDATSVSLQRLALVYGVAGVIYALVLSLPWMITAGGGFPLVRLLWLFVCYAWPGVIVVAVVAATSPTQKQLIFAIYFSIVALIGAVVILRNPESSIGQLLYFWLFANGAPTLLLTTYLLRRIRAVGPLVLTFMVAGVTGAVILVTIIGSSETMLRGFTQAGLLIGVGATPVFVLVNLLGFILLGLFGWWLLGRLGSAYRAKRMSDQSLNLDALWLMFALFQSITLAFEGWFWIFTGLVAFILYKQITRIGFSKLKSQINSEKPPSVLLLRVFSLGRKSERMFDTLSRRWLRVGNIDMIAGPDLVTSTVEPHEFLDYMGGHLSRSFIDTPSVFEKRFSIRNCRPDPDGRYRVNEFFCRNDTWQICMQRLAAECDVVLMDLRSFSKQNQGCLWELEQLLTTVSLDRILFVVDDTTDKTFLEQQLQRLWKQHLGSSPNLGLAKPQVKLFSVQSTIPRVADQLTKRLFEACYPTNSA
ncbi:MAG: hypothetical protein ABW109_13335 [Candidatus Thiodiazotropha sp. 6PLUC4]